MSPDLDVAIESPALTPSRAQAIAHSSWPPDALWVAAQAPSWWRKLTKKETRLSSLHLGAHDILDEEADWNAATWLFEAEQLPRFASTLRRLYELLPEEFTMLAAWGDPPVREEVVTRDGLLRVVLSNQLGNAVLYRVPPQPSSSSRHADLSKLLEFQQPTRFVERHTWRSWIAVRF